MVVLYFTMLAMTGIMESAREGLLTVFGQKITHVVRSSLMEKLIKLSADELNRQSKTLLPIQDFTVHLWVTDLLLHLQV